MELKLPTKAQLRAVYEQEMRTAFPPAELKPLGAILEMWEAGLYRPWFEVICEDGHLALVFHDSLPARLICWAAAALALGVMVAARALWPDGPAAWGYWVPGALALALLLWDFTRPGRVQAAVTRFVRGTLLGGEGR